MRKNTMKQFNIILVAGFLAFVGCASESKDDGPQIKKEVKDVSYQARKDDSQPRKRLMILPFLDTNENRPATLRDKARAEFIKELNKTGEVVAIDNRDLKIDLTKAMKGGEYVVADIAKEASQLGIAAILEGKVIDLKAKRKADPVGVFRQMKSQFEASVRVRIFTARSGKEIFNTVKNVTLEESNVRIAEGADADKVLSTNPELIQGLVIDAFLDFQNQILNTLDRLSWEGRIAMITGDRIFLNVGRISGVQLGDVLKVSEEGDEVYDPTSGNFIGKTPGRLKGTLEVVSYFGQDGAIAIVHSGAGFKENDKVEMY
jgi:hypothetical protein